jgi:uncharacterized protein YabN with tetrapyrrole methylase and pyrophosphatase domain
MSESENGARTAPLHAMEVEWNLVIPTVDVHLVGYGNRLPNDLTLETLAVLKGCKRVFGLPPIHAPAFGIPPMESLIELYRPDHSRQETYEEMAERVLAAAAHDAPVALATYGSPMVGTYATHRIVELAAERGLTVHVSNAVSSFDGIWADLNIDPFRGFEIWEATTFLRLGIQPNTRAHLLLPQAPVLDVTEGIDPETTHLRFTSTITKLRDHLLRFYPAHHELHFVTTGSALGPHLLAAEVDTVVLGELDHPGAQQLSTLLVPGIGRGALDFARSVPAAVDGR